MSASEDEESTQSGSSSTDEDENETSTEEDENDSSEEEEITELIKVGDVRTAFSMATGGKNCCTLNQFPSVLDTLNIKLNEKRTMEFFTMLDEDATNEVGWNAMFYALRDGQSKFKGLPMDQVVGGLLYEFEQSAPGRARKAAVAKKSMISFLSSVGTVGIVEPSQNTLNIPSIAEDEEEEEEETHTEKEETHTEQIKFTQFKPQKIIKQTKKIKAEPIIKENKESETAIGRNNGSFQKLYDSVLRMEETLRKKSKKEGLITGMNNVTVLETAIHSLAQSSVASLKNDINTLLHSSCIHSSEQIAKEISSQLKGLSHCINSTNKLLSVQCGLNWSDKLDTLEAYLKSIESTPVNANANGNGHGTHSNEMSNDDINMEMETDIGELKDSVLSLNDCLTQIISERLLKLEKTVFSLFGQIKSDKKGTYQLMPVTELATQLDLQKANFDEEIRKAKLKAHELQKLLQHSKDTNALERQNCVDEKEKLLVAFGRFLQQESAAKQLRMHYSKSKSKSKSLNQSDEKEQKEIDLRSAEQHIESNNYLPDSKYNAQTANYEKKIHSQKGKFQMKELKSILEYKSIDDIPRIEEDELPQYFDSEQDCDDMELLRLYRANTHLNIELSFLKWENERMAQLLSDVQQPLVISSIGKSTEIGMQMKLQSYLDQTNVEKLKLHKHKCSLKRERLIDKYRLEMYRDTRKEGREKERDLRERSFALGAEKRMIKKLFEVTKLKAAETEAKASEMVRLVGAEILEYNQLKREMINARIKYEDRLSKMSSGAVHTSMKEEVINEEVRKHIEIYKQHLEDEASDKAQEQLLEELDSEKEVLLEQYNEKIENMNADIEQERIEYEKEIKHLKSGLANMQNRFDETTDAQTKYMQRTNEIRKQKSNLSGQLKETQLILKELRAELEKYKTENATANANANVSCEQQILANNDNKGPVDLEAIYAGYYSPSEELKQARLQYKRMKMASDHSEQQIKKLVREKAELSEQIGRLQIELKNQNELVLRRDSEMIKLQNRFDTEVSSKLRPFVKLVESVGRDVLHNAPTSYIFNYKKQDFSELESDLYRDRSDWYIHKNHILRCVFFSIEEWFRDHFWLHERIVQCNPSVHEAMQQVLKDTWMETRIQTHAFIRWFGDLDNEQELKLFYSVQFNHEERYFWNVDLFECIDDYRSGVVEKYYKDIIHEREERREGYWKRHPDVYQLYKQRYIETIKRYKKKLQEKKASVDYIKKNKLDNVLEETDLLKIKQEFQKIKEKKMKQQNNGNNNDNS